MSALTLSHGCTGLGCASQACSGDGATAGPLRIWSSSGAERSIDLTRGGREKTGCPFPWGESPRGLRTVLTKLRPLPLRNRPALQRRVITKRSAIVVAQRPAACPAGDKNKVLTRAGRRSGTIARPSRIDKAHTPEASVFAMGGDHPARRLGRGRFLADPSLPAAFFQGLKREANSRWGELDRNSGRQRGGGIHARPVTTK